MTKIPWRVKGAYSKPNSIQCTKSGQRISVDQLESTTPGFIAQLKGRLTKDKYRCTTVNVINHQNIAKYIFRETYHPTKHCSRNEVLRLIQTGWELRLNIIIICDVTTQGQTISHSAVNEYFQNRTTE